MIKKVIETDEDIQLTFACDIDEKASNPFISSNGVFRNDLMKFIRDKYGIKCDSVEVMFHSQLEIERVFVIDLNGKTRWQHQVELVIQKDNTVAVAETTPPALEEIKPETLANAEPGAEPKKKKATRRSKKRKAEPA